VLGRISERLHKFPEIEPFQMRQAKPIDRMVQVEPVNKAGYPRPQFFDPKKETPEP
jgi:hypothetical protein